MWKSYRSPQIKPFDRSLPCGKLVEKLESLSQGIYTHSTFPRLMETSVQLFPTVFHKNPQSFPQANQSLYDF